MNGKYFKGMGTILHDQNDLKIITEAHKLANKLESTE